MLQLKILRAAVKIKDPKCRNKGLVQPNKYIIFKKRTNCRSKLLEMEFRWNSGPRKTLMETGILHTNRKLFKISTCPFVSFGFHIFLEICPFQKKSNS